MTKTNKTKIIRLVMYVLGLFLIALGVAVSVKSALGTSPLTAIPYAVTCIFGFEMGTMTMLFHFLLVGFQALLRPREFRLSCLLQVLIGILFGWFVTGTNALLALFPSPGGMGIRLALAVISPAIVAMGLYFYLPSGLTPMAPDAAMALIARVTGLSTGRAKVLFDTVNVLIALIMCLLALGSTGSVGIGTVLSALLVGTYLGFYNRHFGRLRDRLFPADSGCVCRAGR